MDPNQAWSNLQPKLPTPSCLEPLLPAEGSQHHLHNSSPSPPAPPVHQHCHWALLGVHRTCPPWRRHTLNGSKTVFFIATFTLSTTLLFPWNCPLSLLLWHCFPQVLLLTFTGVLFSLSCSNVKREEMMTTQGWGTSPTWHSPGPCTRLAGPSMAWPLRFFTHTPASFLPRNPCP